MLQPASFAHMLRETLVITYANLHDLGLADRPHRSLPNTLFSPVCVFLRVFNTQKLTQKVYRLLHPGHVISTACRCQGDRKSVV